MQEQRYRLRFGNRVVGYLRRIDGTQFYSPDGFWWTGRELDYAQVDEAVGIRDKHRVHLYEWDIVRFRPVPEGADALGVVEDLPLEVRLVDDVVVDVLIVDSAGGPCPASSHCESHFC